MAGFDEKAGGAQMGVMQGPMVREQDESCCSAHVVVVFLFFAFFNLLLVNLPGCYNLEAVEECFYLEMRVKDRKLLRFCIPGGSETTSFHDPENLIELLNGHHHHLHHHHCLLLERRYPCRI